ncbi:MAG: lysylphosphatidylglycerol synthase transmembrane domain-containing protein [Myxococcota bacterium]|nr:lysylphosphatidylglycerol synthase transmembrane domain-containing protein [Myxococcota bacterium]
MTIRPKGRQTGAILIALGVTVAVVASLDLDRVRAELSHISQGALAIATLIYLPSWVLRGQRWRGLAKDLGDELPLRGATAAATVGNMLNLILPAKAGDLLWAHAAHVRWNVPYPRGIVGILAGRVLDLVVLATLGGATLLVWAPISPSTRDSVLALAALGVLASGLGYQFVVRKGVGRHLLVGSLKRFQSTHDAFTQAIHTLCATPLRAAIHVAISILIWGLEFLVAWYLALSMGFDLPGWAIIVWIFAANLSKIIPLTPASMGTYEAAGAIALGLAGASYDEAFALVLVEHLLKNSVNLLLGVVFLGVEDLPVLEGNLDTIRSNFQPSEPHSDPENLGIPK